MKSSNALFLAVIIWPIAFSTAEVKSDWERLLSCLVSVFVAAPSGQVVREVRKTAVKSRKKESVGLGSLGRSALLPNTMPSAWAIPHHIAHVPATLGGQERWKRQGPLRGICIQNPASLKLPYVCIVVGDRSRITQVYTMQSCSTAIFSSSWDKLPFYSNMDTFEMECASVVSKRKHTCGCTPSLSPQHRWHILMSLLSWFYSMYDYSSIMWDIFHSY